MRKNLILLIVISLFVSSLKAEVGHSIKVSIKGWADSSIILGHYFNKKLLVNDTIVLDKNGVGTFSGKEKLDGGMYLIYLPNKDIVDILIDEDQTFDITTNKPDYIKNLIIKGSDESKKFSDYQKFIAQMQLEANPLREKIDKNKDNVDSVNFYRPQLEALDVKVKAYWDDAITNNPKTLYTSFLLGIQEVKVPEPFVAFNNPKRDSIIQWNKYQYYKTHAFDNIDLSDPRMYLTPYLAGKIETFIGQTVFQIPDSVAKESVILIEKSRANKQAFKYMLSMLFNLANESKIMGMDKVVVVLSEKYYLSGLADWADKEFLTKLDDRVTKIKPNLVGNIAPELKLQTFEEEIIKLSEVSAPYTILVFWEPECGHCQKEIPKLYNDVWLKYKDRGIKVVAVYTQLKPEPWRKFIEEKSLADWINVYDPYNLSNYRNTYDIYSTPIIYILDKEKRIMAKRIAVEDIPGFFDHYLKSSNPDANKPIMKISDKL